MTIAELLQSLNAQRLALAGKLRGKGVEAGDDEGLTALVGKVLDISQLIPNGRLEDLTTEDILEAGDFCRVLPFVTDNAFAQNTAASGSVAPLAIEGLKDGLAVCKPTGGGVGIYLTRVRIIGDAPGASTRFETFADAPDSVVMGVQSSEEEGNIRRDNVWVFFAEEGQVQVRTAAFRTTQFSDFLHPAEKHSFSFPVYGTPELLAAKDMGDGKVALLYREAGTHTKYPTDAEAEAAIPDVICWLVDHLKDNLLGYAVTMFREPREGRQPSEQEMASFQEMLDIFYGYPAGYEDEDDPDSYWEADPGIYGRLTEAQKAMPEIVTIKTLMDSVQLGTYTYVEGEGEDAVTTVINTYVWTVPQELQEDTALDQHNEEITWPVFRVAGNHLLAAAREEAREAGAETEPVHWTKAAILETDGEILLTDTARIVTEYGAFTYPHVWAMEAMGEGHMLFAEKMEEGPARMRLLGPSRTGSYIFNEWDSATAPGTDVTAFALKRIGSRGYMFLHLTDSGFYGEMWNLFDDYSSGMQIGTYSCGGMPGSASAPGSYISITETDGELLVSVTKGGNVYALIDDLTTGGSRASIVRYGDGRNMKLFGMAGADPAYVVAIHGNGSTTSFQCRKRRRVCKASPGHIDGIVAQSLPAMGPDRRVRAYLYEEEE